MLRTSLPIARWGLAGLGTLLYVATAGGQGPVPAAVGFRMKDGLTIEDPEIRVLDGVRAPDVLLVAKATPSRDGPDAGHMVCFGVASSGVGGDAGREGGSVVRAVSVDQGRSWGRAETVKFNGLPKELEGLTPAAPSAVQLDDGRIRLFFTMPRARVDERPLRPTIRPGGSGGSEAEPRPGGAAGDSKTPRVFSAVSTDGLRFAFEDGARFEQAGLSDPEVIRLPENRPDDGDARKIGPWLMFYTREGSTHLATSRDGLKFEKDEKFAPVALRQASAMLVAADARPVRLYGRGKTGIGSAVFDPAKGEVKADPDLRAKGEFEEPSVAATGDGAALLVFVEKTADKPREPGRDPPAAKPPAPRPGRPPTEPSPPLNPRFPPTDPPPIDPK